MYSETVKRLLLDLPNRGPLPDADSSGRSSNPMCGDEVHIHLKVRNEVVVDSRFEAYGCPGALAAAAGLAELIRARPLRECIAVDKASLLDYLGGLPPGKEHGCDLALTALRNACAGRR